MGQAFLHLAHAFELNLVYFFSLRMYLEQHSSPVFTFPSIILLYVGKPHHLDFVRFFNFTVVKSLDRVVNHCELNVANALITRPAFFKHPVSAWVPKQLGIEPLKQRLLGTMHTHNGKLASFLHRHCLTRSNFGISQGRIVNLNFPCDNSMETSPEPDTWNLVIASRNHGLNENSLVCNRFPKRKLTNEDTIERMIHDNFPNTNVRKHTFGKSRTNDKGIAYSADILLGMHGLNLYNMLYMKSGSVVIEVLPSRFISAEYYGLAKYNGLFYLGYANKNSTRQCINSGNEHNVDLTASPDDISELLRNIVVRTSSVERSP